MWNVFPHYTFVCCNSWLDIAKISCEGVQPVSRDCFVSVRRKTKFFMSNALHHFLTIVGWILPSYYVRCMCKTCFRDCFVSVRRKHIFFSSNVFHHYPSPLLVEYCKVTFLGEGGKICFKGLFSLGSKKRYFLSNVVVGSYGCWC